MCRNSRNGCESAEHASFSATAQILAYPKVAHCLFGSASSGLGSQPSVTAANVHDSNEVPYLLHGNETRFYGNSTDHWGKAQRERLKEMVPKAKDFTDKHA
jgi:hypothetical protein